VDAAGRSLYGPRVPLIVFEGVDKRYGALRALRALTLSLEPGRIGLLGPNGAGKSTLLKAALGLIPVDAGRVEVLGRSDERAPLEIRAHVGYMPEGDTVLPHLTALEYTRLAGELTLLPRAHAIARAHQVLAFVGLGEARYRKLGSFSTGMKQRARLAQALVGDPKLLLLDEPTSGLDPRGRDEMLQLIADIPGRTGASVVLSTHILPDVEQTCDQVVVLAEGQVRYAGALEPMLRAGERTYEVRTKGDPGGLRRALEREGCVITQTGATLEVRLPEGVPASQILAAAVQTGAQVRHLAPLRKTLERAFLDTLAPP